jgi:hypothetical protein
MPVGVGNLVRKPNITEPVKEIIGKKSTSSKPDLTCHYLKYAIISDIKMISTPHLI